MEEEILKCELNKKAECYLELPLKSIQTGEGVLRETIEL